MDPSPGQDRCVNIISRLFHAPVGDGDSSIGAGTVGSSEAIMLAGLAFKRKWQNKRKEEGKPYDKPNMVTGANVQVGRRGCGRGYAMDIGHSQQNRGTGKRIVETLSVNLSLLEGQRGGETINKRYLEENEHTFMYIHVFFVFFAERVSFPPSPSPPLLSLSGLTNPTSPNLSGPFLLLTVHPSPSSSSSPYLPPSSPVGRKRLIS